jgi:hypothetical protein
MNRLKQWSVFPLALIAMAGFAPSAMANELPGLEQEGKPLPVGALVELRATAPFTIQSVKLGNLACHVEFFQAEVVRNETSPKFPYFKATKGGTQSGGWCERAGARTRIFGTEFLQLEATGRVSEITHEAPAAAWLGFDMELSPGGVVCDYYSPTPMSWSFVPGTSSIKLNSSLMEVTPVACGKVNHVLSEYSVFSGGKPVIIN